MAANPHNLKGADRERIAAECYAASKGAVLLLGAKGKKPVEIRPGVYKKWKGVSVCLDALLKHVGVGNNYGIKCGTCSGLDVLDIDAPQLYPEMVQRLKDLTTYTLTGRGHFHFWFKHHERVNKNHVGLEAKIDIRATNAYVVAPGSIHPDTGNMYELHGSLADAAAWPADLLERYFPLKPDLPVKKNENGYKIQFWKNIDRYLSAALTKAYENVRNAPEGTRNHTLNIESYGLGGLAHLGLDRRDVEEALVQAAMEAGLSESEARNTFHSGWGKGIVAPRTIEYKQTYGNDSSLGWDSTINYPDGITRHHESIESSIASSQGGNQAQPLEPVNTSHPTLTDSPKEKRYCTSDGEEFTLSEKRCVHTENIAFDVYQGVRSVLAYNKKALAAVSKGDKYYEPAPLFNRGGVMVHMTPDRSKFHITPRALYDTVLDGKAAKWYSIADKNTQQKAPEGCLAVKKSIPRNYVSQGTIANLVEGSVGLPNITRIVKSPVFLQDGTLTGETGFYPNPGIWYEAHQKFTVKDLMSVEEARHWLLNELLVDFPFAGQSDRANTIVMLLLIFMRDMITGETPLFAVEAPTPGTGKSLLVECCSIVATGEKVAPCAFSNDDAEIKKYLTAILVEGPRIMFFDNLPVNRVIDSPSLAKALTSATWNDRILGSSITVTLPNTCVWIATGNNLRWSLEIARRIVRIRMVPSVEMPWTREKFKHDPLQQWVQANQSKLAYACISIIQRWIEAGKPLSEKRLGSFEEFAAVMGGLLEFAGIKGFLDNANDFMDQANPEAANWGRAFALWAENIGTDWRTAKELLTLLQKEDPDLAGEVVYRPDSVKSFGKQLGTRVDRVHGNYQLVARTVNGNRLYGFQEVNNTNSIPKEEPDIDPGVDKQEEDDKDELLF